jgi:dGTPase
VIEKEIGIPNHTNALDKFITYKYNGNASNYDALILKLLPEKHHYEKADLYERLLHICHFVSLLTDGML